MSEEHISVRQWQERFRAGAYENKDLKVQCAAGWYDWFCRDEALARRLKKISKVVMGITDPYILDNYYVWFMDNCPVVGGLYDEARFEPLSGNRDGKYFVVSLDTPTKAGDGRCLQSDMTSALRNMSAKTSGIWSSTSTVWT